MNKKGFVPVAVLAGLILVVIVGIFLAFFTQESNKTHQIFLAKNICQQSIITAANKKAPDFECKAEMVEIKKEDFAKNADIDHLVKKEIANKMYDCWKMTSEDELNPYPTDESMEYILICGIVSFKEINSFKGLNLWMTSHKPPRSEETYFEIFNKRSPTDAEIEEMEKMEDVYDTSKEYAVVWEKSIEYTCLNEVVGNVGAALCRGVIPGKVITPLGIKVMDGKIIFKPYSDLITGSDVVVMN